MLSIIFGATVLATVVSAQQSYITGTLHEEGLIPVLAGQPLIYYIKDGQCEGEVPKSWYACPPPTYLITLSAEVEDSLDPPDIIFDSNGIKISRKPRRGQCRGQANVFVLPVCVDRQSNAVVPVPPNAEGIALSK